MIVKGATPTPRAPKPSLIPKVTTSRKMENLNVTILEGHYTGVEPSKDNKLKVEPEEDAKHPKTDITVETHLCDECVKVFQKLGPK